MGDNDKNGDGAFALVPPIPVSDEVRRNCGELTKAFCILRDIMLNGVPPHLHLPKKL